MKPNYIFFCVALLFPLTSAVTKQDVLNYLYQISGRQVLSGHGNRQPNNDPTYWSRMVVNITGKWPALYSADFLYGQEPGMSSDIEHRWTMISEAKKQWDNGSLVSLMWNSCAPSVDEPCGPWPTGIQDVKYDDKQWNDLITDGGYLNRRWKERLDKIVPYLSQLRDQGVVVILRLIHEMNGEWYWWGGRPGPLGSARVYQITHEYLNSKLDNLIWVWCVDSNNWVWERVREYYPGPQYVDVLGLDHYPNEAADKQPRYDQYQTMLDIAQGKPIALAETGQIPTPTTLMRQNRWAWFMTWPEHLINSTWNTEQSIRNTYNYRRVLTQGQMTVLPPRRN